MMRNDQFKSADKWLELIHVVSMHL